jgi:hypothetical protein
VDAVTHWFGIIAASDPKTAKARGRTILQSILFRRDEAIQ